MSGLAVRAGWLAHVVKAATQQHHRELEPVLRPLIGPSATVFDVGAHAGQFAKLFARMAPRGRVFAFEPSAYARSVLTPALAVSGLGNIEIVPLGLSDAPGELTLVTPIKRRGGVGFGLASLGRNAADGESLSQTVTLTTLDAFVESRGLERVDFIKADVEGWEAHVLRGGLKTLARDRPVLLIEIEPPSLARAGSTPGEIWDLLKPLGYLARRAPDFAPAADLGAKGDYLLVSA